MVEEAANGAEGIDGADMSSVELAADAGSSQQASTVNYCEEHPLEMISDRHYRSFCMPCEPLEERPLRDKR